MTTIQVTKGWVRRQQKSRAPDSAGQAHLTGRGWVPGRVAASSRSATDQGWSNGPVHGEAWGEAVASLPIDPPESKGGGMAVRSRSTAILSALCGNPLQHRSGADESMAVPESFFLGYLMRNTRGCMTGAMWIPWRHLPPSGGRIFPFYNLRAANQAKGQPSD